MVAKRVVLPCDGENLTGTSVPTADLYQLLAYATSLDLPADCLLDNVLRRVEDLATRCRGLVTELAASSAA